MRVPSDNAVQEMYNADILCVDIESKDPELKKKGPGTHRGDAYICGVGFGAKSNGVDHAYYLPTRHLDEESFDRERNEKIIRELLSSPAAKLGANIVYDLEHLTHEGYEVNMDTLHDVQYAEPLLNEYRRSYSLENLAIIHTTEHKKTDVLEKYNAEMNWSGKAIANLWKMPSDVVEEYVLADVTLPLEIFAKQRPMLEAEGLLDLYRLETRLIPALLKMRKNGVKIDQDRFKRTILNFTDQRFEIEKTLAQWAGKDVNFNSSAQLAKVFDAYGMPYPRNQPTAKMKEAGKPGNPNLDKAALGRMINDYPICETILQYRHVDTLINMFLHPYLDFMTNDRLYGTFHPLRSDDYGTVAGRFSASKPNLQQVSAIDEDDDEDENMRGQVLRSLFIPEDDMGWGKLDYSQVEYRIMAHYAEGRAAEALRLQYNTDHRTDMHQVIVDKTGFDRRTTKRLNFGGAYGMGVATASKTFGWTMEEAEVFMGSYHEAAPYVKELRNDVSSKAARRGFIYTILGRKARTHPSRKLHSMFNRLIQGSAADVMKKAIVDADEKGLFDTLPLHMTVHDELDVSVPKTKEGEEALHELKHTMETTIEFDVPLLVDVHVGANWAEAD